MHINLLIFNKFVLLIITYTAIDDNRDIKKKWDTVLKLHIW